MKQKAPYIISILGMILGVFISILFGINESIFKDKISNDIKSNQKILSIVDITKRNQKIEKEKLKNWRYYQRFHFHATGISGISLATLILLGFSMAPSLIKLLATYMISLGGFLYPYVWLFAAMYGPLIGRTAAKEKFALFGYMGGVFLLGLILAIILIAKYPIKFLKDEESS